MLDLASQVILPVMEKKDEINLNDHPGGGGGGTIQALDNKLER